MVNLKLNEEKDVMRWVRDGDRDVAMWGAIIQSPTEEGRTDVEKIRKFRSSACRGFSIWHYYSGVHSKLDCRDDINPNRCSFCPRSYLACRLSGCRLYAHHLASPPPTAFYCCVPQMYVNPSAAPRDDPTKLWTPLNWPYSNATISESAHALHYTQTEPLRSKLNSLSAGAPTLSGCVSAMYHCQHPSPNS